MHKTIHFILHEIALVDQIKHEIVRELANTPISQLRDYERKLIQDTTNNLIEIFGSNPKYKNINFHRVAVRTWEVLPLIMENKAISNYINKNQHLKLREQVPEVLTPKEGIQYLQKKHPYDSPQELELIEWAIHRSDKSLPHYPKLGNYSP